MKTNKNFYSVVLALAIVIFVLIVVSSTASAATLNVGSTAKYKTIQSAVNAAKDGDTIKVAYGTYNENVKIDKQLFILGTKYPKVDGFYYYGGSAGTINGFSIKKYGINAAYDGGYPTIIRNNYFYNCGISLIGLFMNDAIIMNNQIIGGTIFLNDNHGQTITGNTISKSKIGLYMGEMGANPTVSKNTFKNCNTAVYVYSDSNPGQLKTFSNNKYINNKVNIGWGTKYL
ncbi:MAG TPA: NosD domain-containing protein [Methanosarcina sp.]|jgi:parallel beta-helix repeat protein